MSGPPTGAVVIEYGRAPFKRRFTRRNIEAILKAWPQAVSADEGDLRVLHDMASAGAHMWGEELRWPDYLWLDVDPDEGQPLVGVCKQSAKEHHVIVEAPGRQSANANFKIIEAPISLPKGGFAVSTRISCLLELKVIEGNAARKLARYRRKLEWPDFLRATLNKCFYRRMKDADEQVRDGKRLLCDRPGVVVLVNEGSPGLPVLAVSAYLSELIEALPNIDAVVYLSDSAEKKVPFVTKKKNDPAMEGFASQFMGMLASFDYTGATPVIRSGAQPELLARIEMDARSRAMYRSWATGWRAVNETGPPPTPAMKLTLVRREEFTTGLQQTRPDKTLLDCCLTFDPGPPWDPTPRNLRVVDPKSKPRSDPKDLFPKMPHQVFELCFRPLVAVYGWPFRSVRDQPGGTRWERFFAACSLHQWSEFTWESGFHTLSLSGLHPDTIRRSELILRAYGFGEHNAASNTLEGRKRFEWLNTFVQERGKLPAAVIGACTNKGLMFFDGHIRLAVLIHLGIAEGFDLPMWLASPERALSSERSSS